jgi:predicted HTH domain antitoxin
MEYGSTVNITIEDELLHGMKLSPEQARLEVAVGLFSDWKVTLGRGAEIAGLNQTEFMRELGRRKIPMHYTVEDFEEDLRTLEQLRAK